MFTTMLTIVKVIIVATIFVTISQAKPKKSRYDNKPSKESYDQKQTGEYNIRLHLKDFQIIALLNDGLGDLGDYDYNYDYSELTIKPVIPMFTTSSPVTPSSTIPSITAGNNNAVTSSTSQTSTNVPSAEISITTEKLENVDSNQNLTQELNITKIDNNSTLETIQPENSTLPDSEIIFLHNNTKPLDNETLIAVQVLYEALNGNNLIKSIPIGFESNKIPVSDKKNELNKENGTTFFEETTVSSSSLSNNQSTTELNSLPKRRRCINGFRKDKLGRCRRLRRPGLPFEVQLGRLASKIRKAGVSMIKKS